MSDLSFMEITTNKFYYSLKGWGTKQMQISSGNSVILE